MTQRWLWGIVGTGHLQFHGQKAEALISPSHEPGLSQVFYVSRCLLADIRQVRDLHATCQRNNEKHGLTGLLLFTGDHFAQLLEGPEEVLSQVMWNIARDPRHTAMRKLFAKPVAQRSIHQWTMRLLEERSTDQMVRKLVESATAPLADATELLSLMRQLSARGQPGRKP